MANTTVYFFTILLLLVYDQAFSQKSRKDATTTVQYVLSFQKPNGAFGPLEQEYTDVAWTYPAVHTLHLLKQPVPRAADCFRNGRQSWIEKESWKNGPWYWSLYQKAQLHTLFGSTGPVEEGVEHGKKWTLQFQPRKSYTELRNYPEGEYFDISSLWHLVSTIATVGGVIENKEEVKAFVSSRQTRSGGFEEGQGDKLLSQDEKAHVVITHDAVMTLKALGVPVPDASSCIRWLRACQTPEGGFRWSPGSGMPSNQPDVWYTWAAVNALQALGSEPQDVKACVRWLNSLQNSDGGFGDRPGWASRLYSTYYAVHALQLLTGDARKGITPKRMAVKKEEVIPEGQFSIFQAHHKSPPGGKEMVDSVVAMGLHFVGVKCKEEEIVDGMSVVVREARAYAKQKGYNVEIVDLPENYSHKLRLFSGLPADHMSNVIIPPDLSPEMRQRYEAAYAAGKEGLEWEAFKEQVIRPMLGMKTLFYPELDYSMINAYLVYDDGLDGQVGYNAIPGAHFGNFDWMRHFPYKERWIGQSPIIADGDAHGDIYKWGKHLNEFRNVFLAKSYHFADYVDASLNGRSVCVIRMPTGKVRYYGAPAAVAYLKKHREEWQWWKEEQGRKL